MPDVFVDTNVIAYRFDASEPVKQARAAEVLDGDATVVISTQVMVELYSVLTRTLTPPLPLPAARQVMDSLAQLPVVAADARLVCRAAAASEKHQLSIWDAMIVEAAAEAGCTELWSEDLSAGQVIRGVRIVDPFAPQA